MTTDLWGYNTFSGRGLPTCFVSDIPDLGPDEVYAHEIEQKHAHAPQLILQCCGCRKVTASYLLIPFFVKGQANGRKGARSKEIQKPIPQTHLHQLFSLMNWTVLLLLFAILQVEVFLLHLPRLSVHDIHFRVVWVWHNSRARCHAQVQNL